MSESVKNKRKWDSIELTINSQDEEQEMCCQKLSELEGNGITASDVRRLQENGFYTIQAVAYAPKKALVAVKGISEAKAEKIQMEAMKK
ncbi:DNA repair protein RAD51 like protein 1-like protein, partial [Leptotrombidium deliense]